MIIKQIIGMANFSEARSYVMGLYCWKAISEQGVLRRAMRSNAKSVKVSTYRMISSTSVQAIVQCFAQVTRFERNALAEPEVWSDRGQVH